MQACRGESGSYRISDDFDLRTTSATSQCQHDDSKIPDQAHYGKTWYQTCHAIKTMHIANAKDYRANLPGFRRIYAFRALGKVTPTRAAAISGTSGNLEIGNP